jgi:hypothetical protein
MGRTAKSSIIAWWLLVLIAICLWYRNEQYDRMLAPFLLAVALIQLSEYALHSGARPQQAGWLIYNLLWVQCLLLAIGAYLVVRQQACAVVLSVLALVLLIVAVLLSLYFFASSLLGNEGFTASTNEQGQITWQVDGQALLSRGGWLYLLGITLPLLLIAAAYQGENLASWLLIGYLLIAAVVSYYSSSLTSNWDYLAVGFACVAWLAGITSPTSL